MIRSLCILSCHDLSIGVGVGTIPYYQTLKTVRQRVITSYLHSHHNIQTEIEGGLTSPHLNSQGLPRTQESHKDKQTCNTKHQFPTISNICTFYIHTMPDLDSASGHQLFILRYNFSNIFYWTSFKSIDKFYCCP